MQNRDLYMSQLLAYKDKSLIKVITGMRRSGKSVLLDLFKQHLIQSGVHEQRIIQMNFESLRYAEITDYMALYKYIIGNSKLSWNGNNSIKNLLTTQATRYIFISLREKYIT